MRQLIFKLPAFQQFEKVYFESAPYIHSVFSLILKTEKEIRQRTKSRTREKYENIVPSCIFIVHIFYQTFQLD